MEDLDAVHRQTGAIGHEHRPGRVVALAVRRGAGLHEHGSVAAQLDGAVLAAGHAGRPVDEHRDADAEGHAVAAGPAVGLLPAEVVVPDGVEREIEGAAVVAAVVGEAGRARPGELVGPEEVRAPDGHRVEAELLGEEVDGPIDEGAGLRSAGAAVGRGRRGVGQHGLVRPRDVRAPGRAREAGCRCCWPGSVPRPGTRRSRPARGPRGTRSCRPGGRRCGPAGVAPGNGRGPPCRRSDRASSGPGGPSASR